MATTVTTQGDFVVTVMDDPGKAPTVSFVPIPGTPPDNQDQLGTKILAAITLLENADANWGSLSAAQKDAAMRLAVRGVAKLGRLYLGVLNSA